MDQFLLSASSNQLFVHQIGLPSQQKSQTLNSSKSSSMDEFWFKYAHQVKLENCKNITAICAPNQVGPTHTKVGILSNFLHLWSYKTNDGQNSF